MLTAEAEGWLWRGVAQPTSMLASLDGDVLRHILKGLRPVPSSALFVNCTLQPLRVTPLDAGPCSVPAAPLAPAASAIADGFVGQRWEARAGNKRPLARVTISGGADEGAPQLVALVPPRCEACFLGEPPRCGDATGGEALLAVRSESVRTGDVMIRFVNASASAVRVCWIDFRGDLVEYLELEAGSMEDQWTYYGHWWVVLSADAEGMLGCMVPTATNVEHSTELRLVVPILDGPTTPLDARSASSLRTVHDMLADVWPADD